MLDFRRISLAALLLLALLALRFQGCTKHYSVVQYDSQPLPTSPVLAQSAPSGHS